MVCEEIKRERGRQRERKRERERERQRAREREGRRERNYYVRVIQQNKRKTETFLIKI